jgi:hypothetical protein
MKLRLAAAFLASILSAIPATAQLAPPPATQYSIPIVGTVASASVLVAGIAGERIYVTAVDLVPVATSVVTFSQGTGASCAGDTNVTGALTFSTGQTYSKGSGWGAVWALALGNSLCVSIGTASAPGSIAYSIY